MAFYHDRHASGEISAARADVECFAALSQVILEDLERVGMHVGRADGHTVADTLRAVVVRVVAREKAAVDFEHRIFHSLTFYYAVICD